jgi:flagellar hook-associated protein 1 FlgK
MSISQALNTSLSGLRATQAGLSLIGSNVANAQTPGYVRKTLVVAASTAGDAGSSVRVIAVNREIDQYLQRQLRVESAGGAYADLRSEFYSRLQQIYGDPSSSSSLETVFNNFTGSVQSLVTSPDSTAARSLVLSSAQVLAQTLNGASADIQSLRAAAEGGISDAVAAANDAMQQIAKLNTQLSGKDTFTAGDAVLADQRDAYINQLSTLMDIRVVTNSQNQISVFTNSGIQLVGADAATLSFNPQGTVSPTTLWDADPTKSNLGSITLVTPSGGSVDLIANNSIRSGKIAAYLDMRDNVLVQAQNQLDSLAATMAQALSDDTSSGAVATSGAQSGFSVDTTGWQNGNRVNLTYTDTLTSTVHNISIVRVDDPAALPLDDSMTADPNDEVFGVDFSGGLASVVTQLNARFGPGLQFSNPSGTTLQVLDDGGANTTDVNALSVTTTATALASGRAPIPLFTDASAPFTGAIGAVIPQSLGFAGRIAVNPALLGDPAKLTLYGPGTSSGDPTRPNFIYQQLTNASFAFSARSGLGNASSPFTGSVPGFLQQVLSTQGDAASNAASLAQGQDVVVNALQQRLNDKSGVNVDQEMANLIQLQTAYGANARVMTAIRDMIDTLMRM